MYTCFYTYILAKPFQLLVVYRVSISNCLAWCSLFVDRELSSWSSEGIHLSITFKASITREVLEFEAGIQSAHTVPFAFASSVACTKGRDIYFSMM